MPTYTVAPVIKHDFGASRAGYKLYVYLSGTSTKTTTYTDSAGSAANTNPIVLDSAGRATIFVAQTTLKYVLALPTDTDPPTSPVWSVDGVLSVPNINGTNVDVTGTMGEVLAVGDVVYLSDGAGSRTAGRWYKTDATLAYASALAEQLGVWTASDGTAAAGMTGTVRTKGRYVGSSARTVGVIYYVSTNPGTLQSTAPAGYERIFCIVDTSTSFIFPLERPMERRLYSDYTDRNSLLDANGSDLSTFTLRAGLLALNGQMIRVTGSGVTAGNANNKAVSFSFGATSETAIATAALNASKWKIVAEVVRVTATIQRLTVTSFVDNAHPVVIYDTAAETLTGEVIVKFRAVTATAAADVVQKMMLVEFLP